MRLRVLLSVLSFCVSLSITRQAISAEPSFLRVTTVAASSKGHDVMKTPDALAVVRSSGDLIVADTAHHRILRITPAGIVSVLTESFKEPAGIAIDEPRRLIYVADSGDHVIRSLTYDGVVSTVAGSGRPEDRDGVGTQAGFKKPSGLAIDAAGTIFVADSGNSRIRQITPGGVVTTIAGDMHEGLADGAAMKAQFKQPQGIAIGADGALYIADTMNNVIRKLQGGNVATVAGTGHGGLADGSGAIAEFKEPSAITADESGNLYIADTKNHAIRRLALGSSTVTTIAGSSKAGFVDGDVASASFREPVGIAFAGALYVADSGNDAIRRIDAAVTVTAIDPRTGAAAGGTQVHVFGSGFVPGATQVTFGSAPATNVTYVTSNEVIVTAPAVAGVVDVTITTPAASATLAAAYSTVPPPTIATVTPRKGRTAGGDVVTITGTNFVSGMTVRFGTTPATVVTIGSGNSLTAITPAAVAGTDDVAVTTGAGTATKPAAFTYFAPPVIASFSPATGAAGTIVTINGANFDPDPAGDTVLFGTIPASVTAASPTELVVTAPAGTTTGPITVATAGGSAISTALFGTASYASLEITAPVTSFDQDGHVPFNAIARRTDGSGTDVSAQAVWTSSDANVAAVANGLVSGRASGNATITATFNGLTATQAIVIRSVTVPVVNPSPVDQTVVQPLADAIRFLYAGPGAVQTGVMPNAINDDRVTTVRGSVHTRDGLPLAGVEVTAAGHPELGHTFTRADGRFDLVFNGGGSLTLVYRKAAWIEAQRLITSFWNDQKIVDDVVLIPFDANASLVTTGNPATQIARATRITDADGARTATLIFPAGESAMVTTPDGTTTTPSSLHIRATEYTVGSNGPSAMPAPLPPYSGYTYCVELSADEAGGGSVQYSKPVSVYLENFLSFPVGTPIPVGIYDRSKQSWIAAKNGRVVRIVDISNGLANVDADGDGAADNDAALALLGMDEGERKALASLYAAGQSLWRVRTDHFSPLDSNFSVSGPADAVKPKGKGKKKIGTTSAKCKSFGWSIVDCANQSLGESIPLQGTPFALEYNSSRAGHDKYTAEIELSGNSVPASLERIDLRVRIAGQDHSFSFPPLASQKYAFTWDGRDGFGRPVQGAQKADVTITYAYPVRYSFPEGNPAWNLPGDTIQILERSGTRYTLSESSELFLGHFGVSQTGFGGWTFSGQHFYDGAGRTVYEAQGRERSTDPQQTGETAITSLSLGDPSALDLFTMAPAPDGSVYLSDGYRIRKMAPDGTMSAVAGTSGPGFTPDGATALGNPVDLWQFATGPDGTLYVIDATRVRAIVNGRWVTVAGNATYEQGPQPEGVPATSRSVTSWSLAVGPDGALYIGGLSRIYKIDRDGLIHTFAGVAVLSGAFDDFVDGAPALSVQLGTLSGIAIGPDGTVYFANDQILGRVTPDGRVYHMMTAGSGPFDPRGVSVAGDGTVLLTDINGHRVWAIAPDGSTSTFAGTGQVDREAVMPPAGMSRSFMLGSPLEAKVAADGTVLILDSWFEAILRTGSSFPPLRTGTPAMIPSEDGSIATVFEGGRHTRTVSTLTGVTLQTLGYDSSGNLTSLTDVNGLVTQIERNGAGEPTAVVAPNGQRTTLSVAGGQLLSVTEPSGASRTFGYGHNGLLSSLTDRRGGLHQFTYDDDDLLLRDSDPVGGSINLARTGDGATFGVARTSGEGRTQSFSTTVDSSGVELQTSVGSTGLTLASTSYGAASSTSSAALSLSVTSAPDPRFGMLSPLASGTLTLGTKTLQLHRSRAVIANPNDVFTPASVTATATVNGRTWTSTYDGPSRILTARSPSGRQRSATLDARGRPVLVHQPLLADLTSAYDERGRVTTLSRGTRSATFTYDDLDRVQSVTDAIQRTVRFSYDDANRVTAKTLADGRTVGFSYDAAGNVTSVTPPSRPAHTFTFTGIDFLASYTPPSSTPTTYRYNRDRQLMSMTRPDGTEIANSYDFAGRLSAVATSSGNFSFSYSPATGLPESLTAPSGAVTHYAYDGVLPVSITSSGPVNGSIAIAYDNDLQVTSKTIGNSPPITYGYDGDGLLTSVGMETISREPVNGRVTGTTAGLITDTRSYDGFGQVSDYAALLSASPLFTQHYTHDAAGRVTAIDETTGSTTVTRAFSYDTAGRLATVTQNGTPVATYTYDGNSNRLTRVTPAGTESGAYDDQDRVTSCGGFTFTYTPNGEIASKTSAFGTTNYRYDSFGNLVEVTLPGGHVVEYVLDARSRRVARKLDGAVTQKFLYSDGLRPIAQLAPDDSVVYRFLYAERANVPSLIVGTSATYRVIADHAGSPRGIVDVATGASVEYLAYDEFGNITADTNPAFQPFAFAGGLYDPDTHLVHFGAREYDPSLGRLLTRDPLGLGGGQMNVYDYAANDPVNFGDPSGLMFGDDSGAQEWWVDRLTDPKAGTAAKVAAAVGATFASLWTPCTSKATFTVLVAASTLGAGSALAAEEVAAEEATSVEEGGLNLFKWGDETARAENGWKEGDRFLHLPDQGSPQANWIQNSSRLREEMSNGNPIFDSYRDAVTGEQIPTRGFLNAERNLLENHGWTYDPQAGAYLPPGGY